jgi:predicted transposase/invertase (TIGR01784 family)
MEAGGPGVRRSRLDPKLDIVFWMLFGAEQNRELLISLLNAVLRPTAPIESAEVLHAQPERLGVDDKSIALDVRVRLASGEQVDVEMQSQRRPAQRERALYYWARLYAGQLQRGGLYSDLRRCVVILITNFAELASSRFHSTFRLQERNSAEPLTDHLELHLLELPKLREDGNDEPSLAAWGRFLTATADDDFETLAMADPVLKQAKDALERLSADSEARIRAEQREMALISYELDITKSWREGRAEGRAEGRTDGQAELLRRQLAIKFGQLPAGVAERVASASESELLRWSERVLSADTLEGVFV